MLRHPSINLPSHVHSETGCRSWWKQGKEMGRGVLDHLPLLSHYIDHVPRNSLCRSDCPQTHRDSLLRGARITGVAHLTQLLSLIWRTQNLAPVHFHQPVFMWGIHTHIYKQKHVWSLHFLQGTQGDHIWDWKPLMLQISSLTGQSVDCHSHSHLRYLPEVCTLTTISLTCLSMAFCCPCCRLHVWCQVTAVWGQGRQWHQLHVYSVCEHSRRLDQNYPDAQIHCGRAL